MQITWSFSSMISDGRHLIFAMSSLYAPMLNEPDSKIQWHKDAEIKIPTTCGWNTLTSAKYPLMIWPHSQIFISYENICGRLIYVQCVFLLFSISCDRLAWMYHKCGHNCVTQKAFFQKLKVKICGGKIQRLFFQLSPALIMRLYCCPRFI